MSGGYRVWKDNWDAYAEPVSVAEAVDHVEMEMALTSAAVLVTRGDLDKAQTLRALDDIRRLIEMTWPGEGPAVSASDQAQRIGQAAVVAAVCFGAMLWIILAAAIAGGA